MRHPYPYGPGYPHPRIVLDLAERPENWGNLSAGDTVWWGGSRYRVLEWRFVASDEIYPWHYEMEPA